MCLFINEQTVRDSELKKMSLFEIIIIAVNVLICYLCLDWVINYYHASSSGTKVLFVTILNAWHQLRVKRAILFEALFEKYYKYFQNINCMETNAVIVQA